MAHHEPLAPEALAEARRVARRAVVVLDQPGGGEIERLGLRLALSGGRKRFGVADVAPVAGGAAEPAAAPGAVEQLAHQVIDELGRPGLIGRRGAAGPARRVARQLDEEGPGSAGAVGEGTGVALAAPLPRTTHSQLPRGGSPENCTLERTP